MQKEEIVEFIPSEKELAKRMESVYYLENYLRQGPEQYSQYLERMYTLIKGCYEIEKCRNHLVRFKFYERDKETYQLPFKQYLVFLLLLCPISYIKDISDILDASFIPDFPKDIAKIDDYINYKLIDTLQANDVKTSDLHKSISQVTYDMKRISIDFAIIMGINFNTEMFLHLYQTDERVRELMEVNYDDINNTNEIEELQQKYTDEFIDIVKKKPIRSVDEHGTVWYNNLGIVLGANTGIKHKQLGEFVIAQALKPDIEERVIPYPVSNSILIGGSNKPSYKYIDASAARKSMIMNKKVINILVTTCSDACTKISLIAGNAC